MRPRDDLSLKQTPAIGSQAFSGAPHYHCQTFEARCEAKAIQEHPYAQE
jgi:hypothetical protein